MDIGPINAIRPVAMVRPPRSAPDLSGVFAIEFRHQEQGAFDSPARKASRGLEDENAEEDLPAGQPEDRDHPGSAAGSISFFA